ncbi:MAG TPA: hydroxyethylthiazole kinase [Candidatus Avacidaminococcus intestinavium]|uniref:Hydroxyethylthiazole kinase n=1 Tax=Candidatus Avacidaminococcus intestinavium TaxID=2840684 RepID=A0A9D1MQH9_9FIRM|nr:hydroxyethylthiazole kinase [Candidatus Avacidaminococcus intestinavium]
MQVEEIKTKIKAAVIAAKKAKPLVGSITNAVTINFVANAQLAAGGSAAMVYLPDEGQTLAQLSNAFYINVGTMLPIYAEALPKTAAVLAASNKPWVLDPVAIGIGSLRTDILRKFKEYKPTIIRGNASEIIALAGLWNLEGGSLLSKVRGVDATEDVNTARKAAEALAAYTGGAVAVSGVIDLITDGDSTVYSYGGSLLMERITGAGCSLGGVMGVYAAVADPFIAAVTGSALYNVAGSLAAAKVSGPGSFIAQFLDEIFLLSAEEIGNNKLEKDDKI